MEKRKNFDQIGLRPVKLGHHETHEFKHLSGENCPHCQNGPLDGVTGTNLLFGNAQDNSGPILPEEGSISICSYCGEFLAFHAVESKLILTMPTEADLQQAKEDEQVWYTLLKIQQHFRDVALQARLSGDIRYAKGTPRRFF